MRCKVCGKGITKEEENKEVCSECFKEYQKHSNDEYNVIGKCCVCNKKGWCVEYPVYKPVGIQVTLRCYECVHQKAVKCEILDGETGATYIKEGKDLRECIDNFQSLFLTPHKYKVLWQKRVK